MDALNPKLVSDILDQDAALAEAEEEKWVEHEVVAQSGNLVLISTKANGFVVLDLGLIRASRIQMPPIEP